MKVLMISIDKGLLGQGQLGDVVERHKKYGEFCPPAGGLDIIVLNKNSCHPEADVKSAEGSRGKIELSDKVTIYPTNSKNKLFYYFDALKIGKKLCAENKYDLIVCQDPFLTGLVGLKLKKKFGTKLLVHFHGDYKFPFWHVVKNADGVRVMSQGQKEKLIQKGIAAEKIRVISTPIDLERFLEKEKNNHPFPFNLPLADFHLKKITTPNPSLKRRGQENEKIILFVGRLEEVKNLECLLKGFKLLVTHYLLPVTLNIIGTGSEENKLKQLAKKLNILDKVEFLGQLPQDKIIGHYYNTDMVILSSKSESFGKVLVEANACGKPVVATATTGAKEIVTDGVNGFLVPIGDAKKLAEKIFELLNNPELARQMGENGRKLVKERFGDNTQKIIELWKNIIHSD